MEIANWEDVNVVSDACVLRSVGERESSVPFGEMQEVSMLRLGDGIKLHQLCSEKTECRGLGSKVQVCKDDGV